MSRLRCPKMIEQKRNDWNAKTANFDEIDANLFQINGKNALVIIELL